MIPLEGPRSPLSQQSSYVFLEVTKAHQSESVAIRNNDAQKSMVLESAAIISECTFSKD